jgi:hypothetical protein
MAICPATLLGCIDDLCYGGGCLRLHGEPMLVRCHCGALVGIDGSDPYDECECEPVEWDEPEDEREP